MTVQKLKGILSRPWWDHVHRAVAIVSLLTALIVYYQQQSFIECIAQYNDAQSISTAARSQSIDDRLSAIEDSLTAVDNSIHTVATATSREQVAGALKHYEAERQVANQKRDLAKQKRAENPLPDPPKIACG